MQRGVKEKAGVYPLSPMQQGMLYHHLPEATLQLQLLDATGPVTSAA